MWPQLRYPCQLNVYWNWNVTQITNIHWFVFYLFDCEILMVAKLWQFSKMYVLRLWLKWIREKNPRYHASDVYLICNYAMCWTKMIKERNMKPVTAELFVNHIQFPCFWTLFYANIKTNFENAPHHFVCNAIVYVSVIML